MATCVSCSTTCTATSVSRLARPTPETPAPGSTHSRCARRWHSDQSEWQRKLHSRAWPHLLGRRQKTASPIPLGTTVPLKGQILGGTGRFAGVTGEFDIRRSPVLASEELIIAAGKMVGTYNIGK